LDTAQKIAEEKFPRKPMRLRNEIDSMALIESKKKKTEKNASQENKTSSQVAPYLANIVKNIQNVI
jgi:hypothetical protein